MDSIVKQILADQSEVAVKAAKEKAEAVIAQKSKTKPFVLIGYPFVIGVGVGLAHGIIPYKTLISVGLTLIGL